ncbi:MAG: hypothetical protein V4676_10055, partial [Bacteroidota bacterium]
GKPVISSPITDVVSPYGDNNLVHIVNNAEEFIAAAEKEFDTINKGEWLKEVDEFLAFNSWDRTWGGMVRNIEKTYFQNIFTNNLMEGKKYV